MSNNTAESPLTLSDVFPTLLSFLSPLCADGDDSQHFIIPLARRCRHLNIEKTQDSDLYYDQETFPPTEKNIIITVYYANKMQLVEMMQMNEV